jgi:hypothetical protein
VLSALTLGAALFSGCSIVETRPVQLMSDTATALRAAKQVQADSLAPELYRQSYEYFLLARNEYRFKNFELARRYASKSRRLAEQAEFEAVRNGAQRKPLDDAIVDPLAGSDNLNLNNQAPEPTPAPYEYPTPQPTIYGTPGAGTGSSSPPSPQ